MSVYHTRFSTIDPHFTRPQGTEPPSPPAERPSVRVVRVNEWLNSSAARAYDDKWVLLSDACAVIDADQSAVELTNRHTDRTDPLIVFVQPPRSRIS